MDDPSGLAPSLVWFIYIAHTASTAWAAWSGVWVLDVDGPWPRWIGVVVLTAGGSVLLGGMYEFRSLARMSGRGSRRLIHAGIYRCSRNPQNSGWGLALIGIAVMGRSLAALILAAEFWVAFRLYVPSEQRYLEKVFGHAWPRHRRRTPRFFGWPRQLMYPVSADLKAARRKAGPSRPPVLCLDPVGLYGADDG